MIVIDPVIFFLFSFWFIFLASLLTFLKV